jgi:hypothetical protein
MHGGKTMKCIKMIKTGKIVRVSNEGAAKAVNSGRAKYIAKRFWKQEKSS